MISIRLNGIEIWKMRITSYSIVAHEYQQSSVCFWMNKSSPKRWMFNVLESISEQQSEITSVQTLG